MKKGHVYLVVSREDGTGFPYHYHGIGDLVIYEGDHGVDGEMKVYRVYSKGNGTALFGQWVFRRHLFEIGKL